MNVYVFTTVRDLDDLIHYMTRQQTRTQHEQYYLQLMYFSGITHRFAICYSTAVTSVFYPVILSQRMLLHANITVSSRISKVELAGDNVFTRDP